MRTSLWITYGMAGALALASLPALASGWAAYNSAFPTLPCSDGWAGCVVNGVAFGPGMQKDAAGRPLPADARLGWFDLQPTAALSPFVTLSPYSGAIGGQLAAVEPVPERVVEAPPERLPEPDRVERPPEDRPPIERVERTPPPTAPPVVGRTPPPPTPTPTPPPTVGKAPAPTPTPTPTPPPTATTAKSGPVAPVAPPVVAPPTPAATSDDTCTDLVKLEPQAMLGQLRPGQVKCIDARIGTEGAQTTKDKLSRVLIANAEGKGDKADWERLVKRHLEDIDRSDPDMCFKYSTQLSRGGTGRALGVIRWADYALENKQKWSGATYTKRVYDLYRMKAEAANKLWAEAEDVFATKEHTDENEAKAAKWRGTTKDYAREWLDYAKASGQDTKNAMSICVSAAGNKSFCEG